MYPHIDTLFKHPYLLTPVLSGKSRSYDHGQRGGFTDAVEVGSSVHLTQKVLHRLDDPLKTNRLFTFYVRVSNMKIIHTPVFRVTNVKTEPKSGTLRGRGTTNPRVFPP